MGWSWQDVGKKVGDTLYSITPADNVMNIVREFQQPGGPDWSNVGKNVLGGAADVAMIALPAARAGKVAYYAGSAIPAVAGRAAVSGVGVPLAFEAGASLLGGAGGQTTPQVTAPSFGPVVRPRTLTIRPESSTANFKSAGVGKPYYQQTPYGASPVSTYTDDAGRVHTWNPRSKIYEVTGFKGPQGTAATAPTAATPGAGAAPSGLPALDPRLQAQLDAARRQAVSATEREKADIATRGTQLALASAQEARGAGRRARGGFLDLMSGLAEMGYTGSPAMAGVGQEALRAQEARERATIARELAGGRAALGQQEVAAQQKLRDILNSLAAQELAGRSYASFQGLQNYYGGR